MLESHINNIFLYIGFITDWGGGREKIEKS